MSGSYIPIIKQLFPYAQIVLDRFHIIQHLSRAMMATRIAIMKSFNKKSLLYRAMKNHYSNAKLEATKKLIKDIKCQAFGFRNFKNFKTKILIALNMQRERTNLILSRC